MIFTVLGDLDRRPLTYTLARLISTYGETSIVTNNQKLLTLSNTKESGGYYLDTQVNFAEDVNDYDIYVESLYYTNFLYDGLLPFFSDILFYCSSTAMSKKELSSLTQYNATYVFPIELYSDKNNFFGEDLKEKLSKFEKERQYDVISDTLCDHLSNMIAPKLGTYKAFVYETLTGHGYKKSKLPFKIPSLRRK